MNNEILKGKTLDNFRHTAEVIESAAKALQLETNLEMERHMPSVNKVILIGI